MPRFKCPKCGSTELFSESVELIKFKHHIINDEFVSEKRIELEHESWELFCSNKECDNTEGFPESDLDEKEEIGEDLDD